MAAFSMTAAVPFFVAAATVAFVTAAAAVFAVAAAIFFVAVAAALFTVTAVAVMRTGRLCAFGEFAAQEGFCRAVGTAGNACIHADARLGERRDRTAADAAADERLYAALAQKSRQGAVAETVRVDDLGCAHRAAFHIIYLNQVKVIRTRPERRLLRALRLILIAILGYCCFVYRPNPSQNALFQGAKQSQAGRLPQMQGKARR